MTNKLTCNNCIVSACCTKICNDIKRQIIDTEKCPFCKDKLYKWEVRDMTLAHRPIEGRNEYRCYKCKRRYRT